MDDADKTDLEQLKEGSEQLARDKKERDIVRQQAMMHNEELQETDGVIPKKRIWHSIDSESAAPSDLARELSFRKWEEKEDTDDQSGVDRDMMEQANFDEEVADHAKAMDKALHKLKGKRFGFESFGDGSYSRPVKYDASNTKPLTNQKPKGVDASGKGKGVNTNTHFRRRTPLRPDETETHEDRDDVEAIDETSLDAIIEMGRDPDYRGRRGNYKEASMKKKGVVTGSDPDVSAKLAEHADDMEKRAKKLQDKKPEKEYKLNHGDYMNPDSDKRDTEKYGETAGKRRHDPPKKKRTVADGGGGGGGVQETNENAQRYGSGYMTMGGYEKESPGGTGSELQFREGQERKKNPFDKWAKRNARSEEDFDEHGNYSDAAEKRYNDFITERASKRVNPQNRKDGKPPKKVPPTGAALVKGEGFTGDEGDSDPNGHVKNETKERTNVGFMDGTGREATQAIDEEEDLEELTDGELSEVEKLKARIDDVFDSDKRNRKDLEQDTIGRVGVTDIADGKQIVSLGGGRSGGSWSKEIDPKKEDVFQTAEDLRREGKRATKLTGDDYDVKPQSRKFMRRKLQEGKDKKIKEGLEALKALTEELKGRAPIEPKDTLPKKETIEGQDFESNKPAHRYHESRNRREAQSSGKSPTGVGTHKEDEEEPSKETKDAPAPKGDKEPYDISNTKRLERRRESMRRGNPEKNRRRAINELIDPNQYVTSGVKNLESTPHTKEIQEAGKDAAKKRKEEMQGRLDDLQSQLERMKKKPKKKRTGNVPKHVKGKKGDDNNSAPAPIVRRKKSADPYKIDSTENPNITDWIQSQTEKFKKQYPDLDNESIKKKVITSYRKRIGSVKVRREAEGINENLPESKDMKDVDATVDKQPEPDMSKPYTTWSNDADDADDKGKTSFKKAEDDKQTKFKTEEEIRKEKHEAAKIRRKKIMDEARKKGIGMVGR